MRHRGNTPLLLTASALSLLAPTSLAGFFFSDIRPRSYAVDRTLDIHVGNLISQQTTAAHEFYFLNYCQSSGIHHYSDEISAQDDAPDYIEGVTMYDTELHESFFQYKMGHSKLNALPCYRTLNEYQYENFKNAIKDEYEFRLYVDGLPSATVRRSPTSGQVHMDYYSGVPVGEYIEDQDKYMLYNHWNIVVKVKPVPESKYFQIVGFEVEPRSYWPKEPIALEWKDHKPLFLDELQKLPVEEQNFPFTYTLTTETDTHTEWSVRMEHYLKVGSDRIHYSAILLSILIIAGLLSILNAMMKRSLNQDLHKIYKNSIEKRQRRQERARLPREEEPEGRSLRSKKRPVEAEDVAWKKVHGDVFRTPGFPNILACFMGAGAQLIACLCTLIVSILFAFANTLWRPYIYTTSMVILALFGYLNGYVTSRNLKFFGTTDWNFSASVAAFALPIFILGALAFDLFFAWLANSAQRFAFKTQMMRIVAWYLLNGTMCYYGAYKGYLQKATALPSAVGKVQRPIPDQPCYQSLYVLMPVFGLIQFASMYAEFSYVVDSIFRSQMYAMFGFLLVNIILQVITIALLSILATYMQLSNQDYEWWWTSFAVGGSGSIWIAVYSVFYALVHMNMSDFANDASFLIYVVVVVGCYFVIGGCIGLQASYMFVDKMYKNLRSD